MAGGFVVDTHAPLRRDCRFYNVLYGIHGEQQYQSEVWVPRDGYHLELVPGLVRSFCGDWPLRVRHSSRADTESYNNSAC